MIKVNLTSRARKDFNRLDPQAKKQVKGAIDALVGGIISPIPLTGDWKGWYKIRTGKYRILLFKKSLEHWVVGYIRPRSQAYRK